ncbi:MAG: hypothetical protein JJU20_10210 [Opitutales bacterium]|nr:hypothetical protein [Opitutales bacterium]
MAFDVKEFFDTLDHQLLKERWCRVLGVERLPEDHFALFKNLTEYCWAPREDVYRVFGISRHNPKANRRRQICSPKAFRNSVRGGGLLKFNPKKGKGIPQGAPISALLSNIYMLDFDRKVSEEIKRLGGIYRRYCDDIMIVVPPGSREEAERLVHEEVQAVRLELNGKKTDRVVYEGEPGQPAEIPKNESGFSTVIQYLGFTFDGSKILIRLGSLARYYSKMRAGVSLAKQTQRKQNRKEADQGLPASRLRTRKLYLRYSYLFDRRKGKGRREQNAQGNFLTYAYEAARKLRSPAIKKQVRRHWKKLQSEINK